MCRVEFTFNTSYTLITRSHIHTCMYVHTESNSWSHIDTQAHTESYIHRYAGMHTHVQSHMYNTVIYMCARMLTQSHTHGLT